MAGPGRRALGLLSVARSGRRLWSRGACVQDQAEAMSKNKIPDRWQKYSAVGLRLPGTRFIAFKVPLKKMFEKQLQPGEFFSPTDLLRQIKEQSEELGKIIDLTFTKRYYDPKELPKDLVYEKIFTAGHEVPSGKNILTFKKAVQSFLSSNMNNDKLVGVHCTHGVNRTGYLICRYLIDVDGMDPRNAIDLFNKSRGHPIERPNYTQDLLQGQCRSNKGIGVPAPCPGTRQKERHSQQAVFKQRERPYHGKCRTRNGYREFSQSASPAGLSAQSSGQHRKGQRFGTGAVHQTVRHNGNGQPYSNNEYGTEEQSWWRGELEVVRPSSQPEASQWSGQSGASQWSGQSEASRWSGQPEASQWSGQPKASRWSGQSEASRWSGQPEASQWSGQPEASQWSGQPKSSRLSGQPEASQWSGQSGASQWSGQSGASQWSGQLEASRWSGQLEAPRWSGQPESSQWSGQSEASRRSGQSETVQRRGQSEASWWSGQSEASQWSGQSEASRRSGQPEASRRSGQPEASRRSGQPEASRRSGQSEASRRSGQPEASQRSGQSEASRWSGQSVASRWSGQSEASRRSGQSEASQWSGQPQSPWQSYQPPQAGRGRRGWNVNSGGQGRLNEHRQWDN